MHACLPANPNLDTNQVAELQGVVSATKEQLATAQLQQREAITKLAAAKATGSTGTGTSTGGGGEGGELAQELAAAQRGLQAAQKGLAAEKGHSAEYRRLAQLAEGDKAEQLRLSAEFKATLEAQLATAEEASAIWIGREGRHVYPAGPCRGA